MAEKTYIINKPSRYDRRQRMERVLPNELDYEFTTNWEYNIDSSELDLDSLEDFDIYDWEINSENKYWSRPLTKGQVCCAISHWSCWTRAKQLQSEILILEDDVWLAPEFCSSMNQLINKVEEIDPNWDLIYLGRRLLGDDDHIGCIHVGKNNPTHHEIVSPGFSYRSSSYLLSQRGIKKLVSSKYNNCIIPVDEFLPAMYMEHPREDINKIFTPQLSAYAIKPAISGQLPKDLVGRDTEESEYLL
jgi:glycosyl transferase family 25